MRLLDCTFLSRERALRLALAANADVVGIYCMATMRDDASGSRGGCEDTPACSSPAGRCRRASREAFLGDFDVVVRGEGEQTMRRPARGPMRPAPTSAPCRAWSSPRGAGRAAPPRPFATDLDALAFPARDLLPNADYIRHGRRRYGYAVTTVMSTRGCPFACEFCSNVVFGRSYRERSPANVVDEIEEALALGYDRIAFADDVFTLRPRARPRHLRRDRAPRSALLLGVPRPGGRPRRRRPPPR